MNWIKKLLGRKTTAPVVRLAAGPDWRATLKLRLSMTPEDDALMLGLLNWMDERLGQMVHECDNRDMTGEQALSLAHRIAETAAFRADVERVWKEERAKAAQKAREAGR